MKPSTLRTARAAALAGVLVLAATPCLADDADKDKPIVYSADTGGADRKTNCGELDGNAILTQGTLTLRADRIRFCQNPDSTFSATAFGKPVSFRQRRQGSDEYDEAYAERMVYDGSKQLVELFTHALLRRGTGNEMRSEYIAYDRAADNAVFGTAPGAATGARPASRVTGVISPKDAQALDKGNAKGDASGKGGASGKGDAKGDAKGKAAAPGEKGGDAKAPSKGEAKPAEPLPLTVDSELKSK